MIETIDTKGLIKEAIKEFNKEQRQKEKERAFHNTKLLMKYYNTLKEHIDEVSDDISGYIEEMDLDIEDKTWIQSITRTKLRTIKMICYIDSALKLLEKNFRASCEEYKYKAFKLHYIDKKTNEEIQEILKCGKNSPKKWSDIVTNELSILLWGIDALGI